MRPEELAPEVLRRWWVILLAALVAGLTGYLIVSSEPETYTASARMAAIAEPADYWLDQYAKNRLASYAPLITNGQFLANAMSSAGLDIDAGLAQSKLRISHNSSNNTLTILAEDTEPQRAADIVNATQAAFLAWNERENAAMAERVDVDPELYPPRVVLTPLETAGVPSAPSGPAVRATTLAAALLGALVGGVIVFILIYRDDSLKTPEEIARYLERPLLGVAPPGKG